MIKVRERRTMKAPHRSKIYHNLSRFYDGLFAPFFQARAQATIRKLQLPPGAKALEVGVGTGLSLDAYPPHADVTGIDLSEGMLTHARGKIARKGWTHIHLQPMDALNMTFEDDTFDFVFAFHLVSVVPDSARLMREMVRVCKPGGKIVVINHLRSERKWIASLVDLFGPITNSLGWHTKLTFQDVVTPAPLDEVVRYKTSPQSLFTVVIARKPTSGMN
jgi:phosphatidylethanolamine/phosphatidyl-N-methylethanolamine N-methyltransferase